MVTLELYWKMDNATVKAKVEKRLRQKMAILEKHLASSDFPNLFKIKVESINHTQTSISLQLNLKHKTLLSEKVSDDPVKALELAFDVIKENLLEHLNQYRGATPYKKGRRMREEFLQLESYLSSQNAPMVREEFSHKLLPLIDGLATYIRRRLRYAQLVRAIKPKLLTVRDIVNEVVSRAYDELVQKPEQISLESWLYRLADSILSQRLKQAQWEETHTESWEDYVDEEIEDLEEHIVMDAEGDLYVEDEFEDYLSPLVTQKWLTVAPENEQPGKTKLLKKTLKAFGKVRERDRDIFELYAMDEFTPMEIANMKGMKKQEVEGIIESVRRQVQSKLQIKNAK